ASFKKLRDIDFQTGAEARELVVAQRHLAILDLGKRRDREPGAAAHLCQCPFLAQPQCAQRKTGACGRLVLLGFVHHRIDSFPGFDQRSFLRATVPENAERALTKIMAQASRIFPKQKKLTIKKTCRIVPPVDLPATVGRGTMHRNVCAMSALCVAITAAMAAPAGAETAPGAPTASTAQPVQDQSAAPQATATGKAANSQGRSAVTTLPTIVVTATKRSESLQKVPMAISVLSYHDIQREHLQDFSDYAAATPGLMAIGSTPGETGLSIRGIASGSGQPSASVGVYVDDTPYGSSSVFAAGALLTPDLDPADVERIEVLKGPQGTLYGAGALGGVVRFITIPPDTENYSGRLQLGGTSVDGGGNGFDVHGMVNLPLVKDKLAIRANVYDTTTPGFIDDAGQGKTDVNESKTKGGRVSLLWTPTDKTSLRVTALAQNLDAKGYATEALDPATLQPIYGDLQQRSANLGRDAFIGRYRLYNATFNTDFDWAKFTSSTSYSTLDGNGISDATPLLFLGYLPNGNPYGLLEA